LKLNKLSLQDKDKFKEYLGLAEHELSVYAFSNIYIWKSIFEIEWAILEDSLCIFFRDKIGSFMYLEPLAKQPSAQLIKECFKIMDAFNKNKEISRIENVEEKRISFYKDLGYCCKEKFADFLCNRADLSGLKGDKFKHKRSALNHFLKNYQFEYLPFSLEYRQGCLELYNSWMRERQGYIQDPLYLGMLKDSLASLKVLLKDYEKLNFTGRLVKVDGKLKAFSLGFSINKEIFCIAYEITDLSIQGLAQFIFQRFCSDLKKYKYVNIMDDSGLENLRRVKLSYRPERIVANYIITRKDA